METGMRLSGGGLIDLGCSPVEEPNKSYRVLKSRISQKMARDLFLTKGITCSLAIAAVGYSNFIRIGE